MAKTKVKEMFIERKIDCESLLGTFLNESHYDVLINEDCDVYGPTGLEGKNSERNVLIKFRKGFINPTLQKLAYENMVNAAGKTENRGLASGIGSGTSLDSENAREWITNYQQEMIDAIMDAEEKTVIEVMDPIEEIRSRYPTRESRRSVGGPQGKNNVWVIERFRGSKFDFDAWVDTLVSMSIKQRKEATREVLKMVSSTSYGLSVNSGIAGFFDRYPRIPFARATAYTENNPTEWNNSLPFFQRISEGFKSLMPSRYAAQSAACSKLDSRFLVPNTVFTTITVNKNFRTAAHRDAGDLSEGFSNLIVVSNGIDYDGGYLILPEYRIAVNVRPGDLLLINNHEAIHANTELKGAEGFERVSFVCYFREKMLNSGSWEYESLRKRYTEERSKNKNHPLWRHLWNGVSPSMWDQQEWYDYVRENLGEKELVKYHPASKKVSLDSLFDD